ncbi:unnamed protein product, partial [Ectocarpus sp. 12 AP-2014]
NLEEESSGRSCKMTIPRNSTLTQCNGLGGPNRVVMMPKTTEGGGRGCSGRQMWWHTRRWVRVVFYLTDNSCTPANMCCWYNKRLGLNHLKQAVGSKFSFVHDHRTWRQ